MSEKIVNQKVTYTLEVNGKFFIIENVPARVSLDTGEQFFSPDTVERLYSMIKGDSRPQKVIETPVFEFAAV